MGPVRVGAGKRSRTAASTRPWKGRRRIWPDRSIRGTRTRSVVEVSLQRPPKRSPFVPIDPRLTRLDANRMRVNNPYGVETTLFANDQVPVESSAVTELVELLALQESVQQVAE